MAEDRPNEDKLKFVLDLLGPIDLPEGDCNPHDAEEQGNSDCTIE